MKEKNNMCDICHHVPCDPRCPNAPDPIGVYECAYCGEPIVKGERYYSHNDKYYHDDCFGDAAPAIVVEEHCLKINSPIEEDTKIGKCALCGEPVLTSEEHWSGDNVLYHHECLLDNATGLLDEIALIAEN